MTDAAPGISAVLIVRNESAHLAACLGALQGVVDEIVVADTGSTDDTVAIAEAAGARVYTFVWDSDFSAARNFSIGHATGDYVLVVDADEYLDDPATARARLLDFIGRHGRDTVGTLTIRSYTAANTWVHDETERFFHRESFHYTGVIHEQVTAKAGVKRAAPTCVSVLHHGYAQTADDPYHKARRNIPILKRALAAFPRDEYFWFQLGKARYGLEEYTASIEALRQSLACMEFGDKGVVLGRLGPVSREVLTDAVVTLAYALVNAGQIEEAAQLLDEHTAHNHGGIHRADFPHVQGYIHLMRGAIEASRACYLAALALGPENEDVLGTGSYASHYHLGLLEEASGDLKAAEGRYLEALRVQPDYGPALSRLIGLVVEQQRPLPGALWTVADRAALLSNYSNILEQTVRQQGAAAAQVLIQAAQSTAPELVAACRERLRAMQQG